MTTLTERLTRTGEAVLDLAAALPADLDVVNLMGHGYSIPDGPDVVLHTMTLDEALRAIKALGGIWQHQLSRAKPGADQVHHSWTGTFQGWTVHVVAIWSRRDAAAALALAGATTGGAP